MAILLTNPIGKVIVMTAPLGKVDDVLNLKLALPPGPADVDINNPDADELRQLIQGLVSRLTEKGVSESKLSTLEKSETL